MKVVEYVCPYCKNELIVKNGYRCNKHGLFHINKDIPVFINVDKNSDFKYFQEHWIKGDKNSYPKAKMHVAKDFLNYLSSGLSNKKILDAGCGDGVHIKYLDNIYCGTNKLYGVDISLTALQKIKLNNKNSKISCSDIAFLPFRNEYFDIVFSYGVLAYTSNPKESFSELCRVAKKNGNVGVWFYPRPSLINYLLLRFVRWVSFHSNKRLLSSLANVIVPFLYILPTASKINLSNASWEECKEVVLVNIAPKNIWYPTPEEIFELFEKNNIDISLVSDVDKITIWGVKK